MQMTLEEVLRQGIEAHQAGDLQVAESRYLAILQVAPGHSDANHNLGVLTAAKGLAKSALPYLKTAIKENPEVEQYWLSYIDVLLGEKDSQTVLRVIAEARAQGVSKEKLNTLESTILQGIGKNAREKPNPDDKLLTKLLDVYKAGDKASARTLAIAMTQEFPEHPFAWKILASIFKDKGHIKEALSVSESVTRLAPKDAEAWNNYGNLLKENGENEEALTAFNRAIDLRPNYPEAHFNQAITWQGIGKNDDAKRSYRQAILISPTYAAAYSNLGIILYNENELDEAKGHLRKAVSLNPAQAPFHNNLGVVFLALERFPEAEKIFREATRLACNFPEAHCNLGTSLRKQAKLREALISYTKAIEISRDYADAHGNLGIVYHELGELNESEACYRSAIALDKTNAAAHTNLGVTLFEQGKVVSAIEEHILSIKLGAEDNSAYFNLGLTLENIYLNNKISGLSECITKILQKRILVNPTDISTATISVLKNSHSIKHVLQLYREGKFNASFSKIIDSLSRENALLELMAASTIPDIDFEMILTNIRSKMIADWPNHDTTNNFTNFQIALALQCHNNEYVYYQSEEETAHLNSLEAVIKKKVSRGKQPNSFELLCLASYKELSQYKWINKVKFPKQLQKLKSILVTEVQIEKDLKANIKRHEEIIDDTSEIVREQYEHRPYPRYTSLRLFNPTQNISQVVKNANLKLADQKITTIESPNVLIAGCGTGSHSISSASRHAKSKVLAIDLSLSSLAFAKRKTAEMGISNVEYLQADILNLSSLQRKFHIIESSGVLHHMKNPMAGWEQLVAKLERGGLMKIGLYSELARQHIVQIRREIKLNNIGTSDKEIIKFRQTIFNSNEEHHKLIASSLDFYSLSETRDLLFHEQEHRFTIREIRECLSKLKLTFSGFEGKKVVALFDSQNKEKDSRYDLEKWESFEEQYPRSFSGMYQFWCQKH